MSNLDLLKWIKDYPKNLDLFREVEHCKTMENQTNNHELLQWVKDHQRQLKSFREIKSNSRKMSRKNNN